MYNASSCFCWDFNSMGNLTDPTDIHVVGQLPSSGTQGQVDVDTSAYNAHCSSPIQCFFTDQLPLAVGSLSGGAILLLIIFFYSWRKCCPARNLCCCFARCCCKLCKPAGYDNERPKRRKNKSSSSSNSKKRDATQKRRAADEDLDDPESDAGNDRQRRVRRAAATPRNGAIAPRYSVSDDDDISNDEDDDSDANGRIVTKTNPMHNLSTSGSSKSGAGAHSATAVEHWTRQRSIAHKQLRQRTKRDTFELADGISAAADKLVKQLLNGLTMSTGSKSGRICDTQAGYKQDLDDIRALARKPADRLTAHLEALDAAASTRLATTDEERERERRLVAAAIKYQRAADKLTKAVEQQITTSLTDIAALATEVKRCEMMATSLERGLDTSFDDNDERLESIEETNEDDQYSSRRLRGQGVQATAKIDVRHPAARVAAANDSASDEADDERGGDAGRERAVEAERRAERRTARAAAKEGSGRGRRSAANAGISKSRRGSV